MIGAVRSILMPEPNANGWYNSDVTIHWTFEDSLSGIDPATTPTDTVITGAGNNLSATATVRDLAGNETSTTVSGIKIKRQPPALALLQPGDGKVINSSRPVFSGTAEVGATVQLYLDDLLIATLTADPHGAWTYQPPTAISTGSHTRMATATDVADNMTTSAVRTFKVDTSAPSGPPSVLLSVSLFSPGEVVSSPTPTLTGTTEPGSSVTVSVDGTAIGTVTASSAGTFSVTPSKPLADGLHALRPGKGKKADLHDVRVGLPPALLGPLVR